MKIAIMLNKKEENMEIIDNIEYFSKGDLKELGMYEKEIRIWLGEYDRKGKSLKYLYEKKRCLEILESSNWKAWITGEGYVFQKTRTGKTSALIMDRPRSFIGMAVQTKKGKWLPKIKYSKSSSWVSFSGGSACDSLEECRKAIENRPYKTYEQYLSSFI
jgi:hypothetical protein